MPLVVGLSALPVFTTTSLPPSIASQAQPLPNWPSAAFFSSSLHAATLPNDASISFANSAGGSPPPPGFRLIQ